MPEDAQTGPPGLKVRVVDIEADEIRNFQVPTFVNYVNVWRLGSDVYVDMGLVTVEDLGALKPDIGQATVAIYDRFVMSPATFDELAGRMTLLRGQLKAEGLIRDGAIETPKAP
ncbi:MAG: hypothetical protein ABSC93_11200 [Bryobacteraceae bacterium]|jgi:hypothetical protein